MGRLLIVEDDADLRGLMSMVFREGIHQVDEAADGETARRMLGERHYDVVLADLMLPGADGLSVLKEAKTQDPGTEVIIITAFGTLESAVQAFKLGASDYLQKPFEVPELVMRVEKAFSQGNIRNELAYLRHERSIVYRIEDLVGTSPAMEKIKAQLQKVAPLESHILISGEEGTGKELVAGAIHYNSPRRGSSFVSVKCVGLSERLLESELFGHEKAAFPGATRRREGRLEQADGGTLYLAEVADMPRPLQKKLILYLRENQFTRMGDTRMVTSHVRVIGSTSRDPDKGEGGKGLDSELLSLLSAIRIALPPLRERKEDIRILAEYFLKKFRRDLNKSVKGLTERAMTALEVYSWPGNLRELANTLEHSLLVCSGEYIDAEDLTLGEGRESAPPPPLPIGPEGLLLKQLEKEAVLEALRKTNFVQKDAAELLGISKRAMHYKVTQFGIKHPRWLKNK